MNNIQYKEDMNIVIVGHVDHGKSTVIGRLLVDTDSLPEGKLEQVKEKCRRNSKPFEFAFLLDALKDEQSQGITIDSARCFFKTKKRDYIIIDAPGHIEFLKNMITGAARAEAALLVIDADEGIQENSKRHGYMLSMLGIKQVVVLVNKMDLINYNEETYRNIESEYTEFLNKINIDPVCFIPVSAMMGDNIADHSEKMSWYKGMNVLEVVDTFKGEKLPENKPFRMPVQDVYKFTRGGDDRRIIAGTVETGKIKAGEEVVFYPSGKKSTVKTIEGFNIEKTDAISAGQATGFTMAEQIYVKRGEIACRAGELKPKVTTRIKTNLFWLGRKPMEKKKTYYLKLGTAKVGVKIEQIINVIDASNLDSSTKEKVERHEVAEVILKLERDIAFDLTTDISQTSRFVIVDEYEISGGGIVLESLEDSQSWMRDKVLLREYKWEKSTIAPENRAEKYNQKSALLLITGEESSPRKEIAKALEEKLFDEGKVVYFLGLGNLLYGVDADIKNTKITGNHKEEHFRRLAEVCNIMLDAGVILLVTARELTQEDLEIIKTAIDPEKIEVIWTGEDISTDITYDLHIARTDDEGEVVSAIKALLQERGYIFRPW